MGSGVRLRGDAARQLERALIAGAAKAGCRVAVTVLDSIPWASVTFSGARHEIVLSGAASLAMDRWAHGIGEAEFALRGHLVADARVMRIERREGGATVALEFLTLEEA